MTEIQNSNNSREFKMVGFIFAEHNIFECQILVCSIANRIIPDRNIPESHIKKCKMLDRNVTENNDWYLPKMFMIPYHLLYLIFNIL